MRLKDVVALKEVVDDLDDGKAFYEQNESNLGQYFWDGMLADIESLVIYAGVHSQHKQTRNRTCQSKNPSRPRISFKNDSDVPSFGEVEILRIRSAVNCHAASTLTYSLKDEGIEQVHRPLSAPLYAAQSLPLSTRGHLPDFVRRQYIPGDPERERRSLPHPSQ